MDASSPTRWFDVPALVVAVILFVLAGLVLRDAVSLSQASAYGIGPEAMPYVVGAVAVEEFFEEALVGELRRVELGPELVEQRRGDAPGHPLAGRVVQVPASAQ